MKAFMRTVGICACLGAPIGMLASIATAELPCEPVKITASDRAFFDAFGDAIAIDGDTVVVGARREDENGFHAGAAYVYRWIGSAWVEEAKLTAPDGAADDKFGRSVGIDGNTIIVGADRDDIVLPDEALRGVSGADAGSAYIFTRTGTTWTMQAKLTAFDADTFDNFGAAVSINGGTAIVGSPNDDDGGGSSGSVYVYRWDGTDWLEQAKLTATDATSGAQFGSSVANHDDTAVVGAPSMGTGGVAYVFNRDGTSWNQEDQLIASDAATNDAFGSSVALDGDTVVVGAPFNDDAGSNSGSAYIFARDDSIWSQQWKLAASDAASFDNFGDSVGISGDTAIVGSPFDDNVADDSGSSYVFTRSGTSWSTQGKLIAPDPQPFASFGSSVGIDGDTVVCGAVFEGGFFNGGEVAIGDGSDRGKGEIEGPGAAYVFQRIGPFWIGPDQIVSSSDPMLDAQFGSAVAIDGDTALIGAFASDGEIFVPAPPSGATTFEVVPEAGAVFVYRWNGSRWMHEARLTASDGETGDAFGWSVDLDGDTAIIGANMDDDNGTNSGSAYIFQRSGTSWFEASKLTASNGAINDRFGGSVGISAGTAIVGAELGNGIVADTGTVYIFSRDNVTRGFVPWVEQTILTPFDPGIGDRFGCAVAIDGDLVLIGSKFDDDLGGSSGSAYIFKRTNLIWTQRDKLLPSDGDALDEFGFALDLSGGKAVICAPRNDDAGSSSGSAYIFADAGTTWVEVSKLTSFDAAAADEFGISASIAGDTVVIGARNDDDLGSNSGSAYVFRGLGSSWIELRKVTHPAGSLGDQLGTGVATNGTFALAGVPFADDAGADTGSALFFTVAEECMPPLVRNITAGTIHGSLAHAVNFAASTHVLEGTPSAFIGLAPLDFLGKLLSISSTSDVVMPFTNTVTLANGASLNTAAGESMTLYGLVDLPSGATSTFRADSLRLGAGGHVNIFPNATLSIQIPVSVLEGSLTVFPGASVSSTGPLMIDGQFSLFDSVLSAPTIEVGHGGRFVGGGSISGSVVNRDQFITIDSTLISGDLFNAGGARLTVQIGTLTLLGSLTNDGIIVGDLQSLLLGVANRSVTQAGDGFSVSGAYHAGAQSSLLMASDLWKVSIGGDFDVAIADNTRFNMAQAELNITSVFPTDLELMSVDIGNAILGLDRTLSGQYPLGALRLSGNVTTLVDRHDNDGLGQANCEAIYVSELIIEAGATLNTGGCTVYYETLINNGTVDNEANLVQLIGFCAGDANSDGVVNFDDITSVLSNWLADFSPGTGPGDANQDGIVDFDDITAVLSNWLLDCPV